jgi:hypothetical protein
MNVRKKKNEARKYEAIKKAGKPGSVESLIKSHYSLFRCIIIGTFFFADILEKFFERVVWECMIPDFGTYLGYDDIISPLLVWRHEDHRFCIEVEQFAGFLFAET